MIKLVAVDVDGSLVRDDGTISREDKQAVKDLENAGIKVMVVTGRLRQNGQVILDELDLNDEIHLGINGTLVLMPGDEEDYLLDYMEKKEYEEFVNTLREEDRSFIVFTPDGVMYDEMTEPIMEHFKPFGLIPFSHQTDCRKIPRTSRVNIEKRSDSEEERAYIESIIPESCYCTATPSENMFHVLLKGTSKGSGLKKMMDRLGIKKEEVASFGDQEVDTFMFEHSALSVAVKNADDITKEKADVVLDRTNNENAFAYMVYRYILNDEKKAKEV